MGRVSMGSSSASGVRIDKSDGGFRESPPPFDLSAVLIRVLDVVFSVAGLIFIAPLMVFIAGLCWLQDKGPICSGEPGD